MINCIQNNIWGRYLGDNCIQNLIWGGKLLDIGSEI